MNRRSSILTLLIIALCACTKAEIPVEPVWGKQPCAHCAMILGDRRYGAQVLLDGEHLFFDDIGCAVLWTEEHQPRQVWVKDAQSGKWFDAKSARFMPGAHTPMDFGFEARPDGTFAWAQIRAEVLAKARLRP